MKKIFKRLFVCLLFSFFISLVAGCSTNDKISELENKISSLEDEINDYETTISELQGQINDLKNQLNEINEEIDILKSGEFQIKVYDIDDELLGSEKLYVNAYSDLFEALEDNFNVVSSISDYGHYITSINNSIVDNNYYIAIYENSISSSVGIDSIEINSGDLFEFKVECWNTIDYGGTMDEYDILLDKAIYHYIKNTLEFNITNANDYTLSTYWECMSLSLLKRSGIIDNNLLNIDFNNELINSLNNADVSSLSAINAAKYYFHARLVDNFDFSNLTSYYTNYLSTLTSYTNYGEYSLPFILSACFELGLSDNVISDVYNTTYRASTSYGIDGLVWQLTGLALYTDLNMSELDVFVTQSNEVSEALMLMAYSAIGGYCKEGNDIIKTLFDDYYDKELLCFEIEKTSFDYSSNQIYSSLITYKLSRDLSKKVNIFA